MIPPQDCLLEAVAWAVWAVWAVWACQACQACQPAWVELVCPVVVAWVE